MSGVDLKALFRARAQASLQLGLAQKVKMYRFNQEDDAIKCDCNFDLSCERCYGTGIVDGYGVVQEVLVEKPHHTEFVHIDEKHFLFCHKLPIMRLDVFYWRELGTPHLEPYYVASIREGVPALEITNVFCRSVPSWSPLKRFPLEKIGQS